jgi:poly(A) polymerase
VPEPIVIPREAHPISRRDIDPDALKVLYRLQAADHIAYLVGGSVRDLLLGRRPKDFDIGTDAHPYQIKRLFRNCWIIGRRFRLAHIKFGQKTIEVATFRKNVADLPAGPPEAPEPGTADTESAIVATAGPDGVQAPADGEDLPADSGAGADLSAEASARARAAADLKAEQVHRDNTYGTTEEDAFRRDFTVNALFYDVATRSIIDYVGGLADLERRVIRSIGDPRVRFVEDPVRMLRAAVLGARLGFDLDVLVIEAIAELRQLILKASPARLLEEYFKILRSGWAEASFRALARVRLLELMTPELKSPPEPLWDSLARLDAYRRRFPASPPELTTPVLMGSLLVPIGALNRRMPDRGAGGPGGREEHVERVSFGALPVARKDLDRLRQLLQTLPRLTDPMLPPRVARGLPHRPSFLDAVTWLEVFGNDSSAVERWKAARAAATAHHQHHPPAHGEQPAPADAAGHQRRRRRRRRRGRRRGTETT